jgi:hypothetical protein
MDREGERGDDKGVTMTIWQSISSFWTRSETYNRSEDKTRQPARIPISYDWTDNYPANTDLTRNLYHNTYPGMKLAGGLAYPPIAVPVWFMGVPTPKPVDENDEATTEELEELVKMFSLDMQQIHTECHRDGTVWIWPHWSAKLGKLIWEFIRDDAISAIVRDLDTGEIVEIITDEEILVQTAYQKTGTVRRRRTFTREKITVEWLTGKTILKTELKDRSMRNPTGILPIPFANNGESGYIRGHSDYERIITDLKDYHDIDLARSTMLAKFNPKMIQEVKNVDDWLTNNGWATIADIDIAKTDLIINLAEQEKTSFEFPENAHEAYGSALKQKFQKIVEASGVPEIAWGLKTEGNRASVEESMGTLIKYVHDKQDRKKEPYKDLFLASLKILRAVSMVEALPDIEITWNDLDAVSDEVRSQIFGNFCKGVAEITKSATVTKQQLFNLWKGMYPETTEENYDEFVKGMSEMGAHNQWNSASYTEALDFQRGDDENTDDGI